MFTTWALTMPQLWQRQQHAVKEIYMNELYDYVLCLLIGKLCIDKLSKYLCKTGKKLKVFPALVKELTVVVVTIWHNCLGQNCFRCSSRFQWKVKTGRRSGYKWFVVWNTHTVRQTHHTLHTPFSTHNTVIGLNAQLGSAAQSLSRWADWGEAKASEALRCPFC